MNSAGIILLMLAYLKGNAAIAEWQPGLKTFSHAVKSAICSEGQEIELFRRDTGRPGVVTEQWFTGGACFGPNSVVRYYIDGDVKPTIEVNLYLMHGIGYISSTTANQSNEETMSMFEEKEKWRNSLGGDAGVPWGTRRMGHLARTGALYNTIRMPFQKSIRVTFILKSGHGVYWYIIRGAENYPIVIGDLTLPKTAMLKLHKIENSQIQPLEYVLMASSSNRSGLLYQVTLATTSTNFEYLEACFRILIDDENDFQYMSSGTEDFFLSAYYYNAGLYHTSHAGLTYLRYPGTMSAYKFFEDDPVAFSKSFKLVWRCGEIFTDNECFKLSNADCYKKDDVLYCKNSKGIHEPKVGSPQKTTMSSYVWTYEWPN